MAEFSLAQDNLSPGQSNATDNPPGRVARISYLKGSVSFLRAGLDQWSQAAINFPVTTGDRLYTDDNSRAELQVGFLTVRIWERTDLTVTNLSDRIAQFGLQQGTLRVSVYSMPSDNTVELDTPNGSLTILDPGKYRVDTDPDGNRTTVTVNKGSLQITGGGVSETIDEGEAVQLTGQDSVEISRVPVPAPDSFDDWSNERDRRRSDSTSSEYVNPYTPGYEDLDDYGHWTEVDVYGPVWFPTVPVGWVPFRFGYWAWVDPWGWTWMADEVWGFCTFHYGRWVFIRGAWGWLPGPMVLVPVYAPALVAFLGGPSFSAGFGVDLVGWFPLGPVDPFFPWYHSTFDYVQQVNITNIRNVTNITQIIHVDNINNVHYAYKDIATTAVPASVLSSGQPVAQHAVKLTPEQVAKAQVIPHPTVNPTPRAAMPGKPVPPPPTASKTTVTSNRIPGAGGKAQPSSGAMNKEPERTPPVPERSPHTRPPTTSAAVPPRTSPARLITRMAPLPPPIPFHQRQEAMAEHPGRSLEPIQVQNLLAGKPAGPHHDVEFPPHPEALVPKTKTSSPPKFNHPTSGKNHGSEAK
ncbi:MAG TPA: DUF6600 domain-containing protein [Terriglobales bacterium]|nr:DUF6600 domain-containing protein [Terriglobales bacterium]